MESQAKSKRLPATDRENRLKHYAFAYSTPIVRNSAWNRLSNSLIVRIWTELWIPSVGDASRPWQRSMMRANSSYTNSGTFATQFGLSDSKAQSLRLLRELRNSKTGTIGMRELPTRPGSDRASFGEEPGGAFLRLRSRTLDVQTHLTTLRTLDVLTVHMPQL